MTGPTVIYVASLEPESGKSLVSFGAMEVAATASGRVGYFRPVIAKSPERDRVIEMMRSRFRLAQDYEESYGVTTEDTRGLGESVDPALVHAILAKFEVLARSCDVVVVEGTDYTGASAAFEFALNSEIAAHLGASCVIVARAHAHRPDQLGGVLSAASSSLAERHVPIVGFVVNRVPADELEEFRARVDTRTDAPIWFMVEEPALGHVTMGDLAAELGAEVIAGDAEAMTRDIHRIVVAAMTLPHLMRRLEPHALLVTPGDRADVILMAEAAQFSSGYPPIAGLLLTGGYRPDDEVLRLTHGLGESSLPILLTERDTYETVDLVSRARGSLESGDERRLATGLRLFEDSVDFDNLVERVRSTRSSTVTPVMFERQLMTRAREDRRRIVLPEGDDDRILRAAGRLLRRGVAELTILGEESAVRSRAAELGVDLSAATVLNPRTSELCDKFADQYAELRKKKGVSLEQAREIMHDVSYFGTMLVQNGFVDGMVSGAAHTTAHTVRPAFEIIKTRPGVSTVSSIFLMCLSDRVLAYGDCAIVPDPTPDQLADIAISAAYTAAQFGIEPRVAMLSYSTGDSGSGAGVDKVRAATDLVRQRDPNLLVEGPIQYDAAVDPDVAAAKMPDSPVAGKATVLIFPDLNTGNNTYKAVQRSAGAIAIGPVLQGLNKPVNDLSRGALVEDIVYTVAITAIQAQGQ